MTELVGAGVADCRRNFANSVVRDAQQFFGLGHAEAFEVLVEGDVCGGGKKAGKVSRIHFQCVGHVAEAHRTSAGAIVLRNPHRPSIPLAAPPRLSCEAPQARTRKPAPPLGQNLAPAQPYSSTQHRSNPCPQICISCLTLLAKSTICFPLTLYFPFVDWCLIPRASLDYLSTSQGLWLCHLPTCLSWFVAPD